MGPVNGQWSDPATSQCQWHQKWWHSPMMLSQSPDPVESVPNTTWSDATSGCFHLWIGNVMSTLSDLRYAAWKLKCINKYTSEAAVKFRTSSLCQSWESEVLIWIFPDTVFTRLYAHLVWRVRSVTELRSRDCHAGSCDAHPKIYFQSENPSIELFMTPTLIILQLTWQLDTRVYERLSQDITYFIRNNLTSI